MKRGLTVTLKPLSVSCIHADSRHDAIQQVVSCRRAHTLVVRSVQVSRGIWGICVCQATRPRDESLRR